ncbi:MAG: 3-isopropylmalate dehydratase large subunit [Christensenellaceae bacterium]|jgi:3-isopropylmalate/(R)-2-methylmalate dehydratase large subunit|nr:3-isopropylmalate dehydratase large subunit [Christensenellaceae bacterium]
MGMTMTQKIMAKKSARASVNAGELLECSLDLVFGNDITAPVAIDEFYKMGVNKVFDTNKVALIPDHFTPNKDIAAASLAKKTREFAKEFNIKHYFEVGRVGVEHALLPEIGLIKPGDMIIGADSHTCTHGALGAFATGVGSTDMAAGMATGKCWFKVPEAIKILIKGKKRKFVSGKDAILWLIGKLGVDGARYKSLEFTGDISELSLDERFTIANMAVEAGAKNGIFPVDEKTREYLAECGATGGSEYVADKDAQYCKELVMDFKEITPMIAFPHLPENTKTIEETEKLNIKIDQVIIGSCTNGRMEDMRIAAQILKGQKIASHVRCLVIPATQKIWKQCVTEGIMEVFVDAGVAVSTPTCGPCLGGHMGILAEGERCVSTTNRNFVGRMGHVKSEVYLASPAIAAASAVAGIIISPDKLSNYSFM